MKLFLLILSLIIFIIFALVILCFLYVFYRHQNKHINDITAPINKFLRAQQKMAEEGIDFINQAYHENVSVKSFDGLKLAAKLYTNVNSLGTIILFHGYRASANREFCCTIKMYYETGFNILLIDQRSHSQSEGSLITFGIKESIDAVTWTNYINDKFGTSAPIFLCGISMGASTVMMATGRSLPSNVKGIIADCGFTSVYEIIYSVAARDYHIKSKLLVKLLNIPCYIFGKFDIYKYNTKDILKNNTIPILFIHGKEDHFVPCFMSEDNYKANSGEKYIILIDEARHGRSFLLEAERLTEEIQSFIKNHI